MIETVRAYSRLLAGTRGLVVLSAAISIVQSALLIPVPLIVKEIFDHHLPEGDAGAVMVSGIAVLVLYVGSGALGLVTRHTALKAINRGITRLRSRLLAKLYEMPPAFFDRRSAGELHAIVVQDTERLDTIANAALGILLPSALIVFGLAIVGLAINPLLFALLACALPGMMILTRLLRKRVGAATRAWQGATDLYSARTQLALRAMALTKVSGAEQVETERARPVIAAVGDAGREMAWKQAVWGIVQGLIAAVAGVVVLVVGGRAVARGSMSLGELISFFAIVAVLQRQVTGTSFLIPVVVSGGESQRRLEALLDADSPTPQYGGKRAIDFQGGIELRQVSFGYDEEPLLHEIDLQVEPGEHIAVLGPNGAGKSTLGKLVLGLYRPWSGTVLADGVAFDELDLRALRKAMGVVLQDPIILPGTVAENIAYGRPEASREDIRRAAEMAAAVDFIARLPGGLDAQVGDEGALLSGGQRQRLAIARALIADPRLLILDEPTTHLDDEAIATLRTTLASLAENRAVLTITHDQAVAELADRLLSLRDGRIVDEQRLRQPAAAPLE